MSLPMSKAREFAAPQRLFRMTDEQRQGPRVKVSIGGRFMRPDRSEYGACIINASLKTIEIETDAVVSNNERIVGYFYTIGRLEGKVIRVKPKSFILELVTTLVKRDRLASQLIWLANREILNLPEDRRHDRIVPSDPRISVRNLATPHLEPISGHLIDVSRSGAALSIRGAFEKGDEIVIGTTPARVVRAFDGGLAVEFHGSIPEAMFDVSLRL
jgi:hypothetical protein